MHFVIQIILYQLLFLGVYQLIKREPFFQLNRLYLLITLGASFVLPFIDFSGWQIPLASERITQLNSVLLPEVFIGEATIGTTSQANMSFVDQFYIGLEQLYWLGLSVSLSLFYVKLKNVYVNINSHMIHFEEGNKVIYLKNSTEAFSIFQYIFLGDQLDAEQKQIILAHEQAHVKHHHSLDNSLVELLQVLMWFNPLIFLYLRELQLVHEYQADAKVCKVFTRKAYTLQLLNFSFSTHQLSLMSPFYTTSFIKNRITMLQKKSNHFSSLVKYAIVTPILFLAFSFSLNAQENLPKDEQALLEKYTKEIFALSEKDESLVYKEFIANLEKDENGIFTKESVYKFKAFTIFLKETVKGEDKSSKLNSEESEANMKKMLNTSYEEYLTNSKSRITEDPLKYSEKTVDVNEEIEAVPFATVYRVPIYPGCDDSQENEAIKQCMSEKITAHVAEHFKTSVAKDLDLSGVNRVYVRFMISKEGKIEEVDARSAHPILSEEGKRVIKSLPTMQPGINKDETAVGVMYTLPITFQIPEEEVNEAPEIEKN